MTYTIDTLVGLKRDLPVTVDLFYIVGVDTLYQIKTWKDYEEVIKLTSFISISRAGYSEVESWAYFMTLSNRERARIAVADKIPDDISSTEIRYRVAQGLCIDKMVPNGVQDIIAENNLYLDSTINYDEAEEKLKNSLSEIRFRHSTGTVECAEELAKLYGVDIQKAKWAALLHDCAKELAFKPLDELHSEYGLEIDKVFKLAPALIHSKLGAIIAKKEYNMLDDDILQAIKYHTTGRINMTVLDKIIFLADFIEPNRNFAGLEEIRAKSKESLDEAVLMTLDIYIENIIKKDGYIDSSSVLARNELWLKLKTPTEESDDEEIF